MPEGLEIDNEGYIKLVEINQLEEGEMVQVTLTWQGAELEVCLAYTEGQIYAFRDICPHMSYPLSIGTLKGTRLECRGHGWRFDLKSGKAISPPIRKTLEQYQIKILAGMIWVKLES